MKIEYPITVYTYYIKGMFTHDGFTIHKKIFESPPNDGTLDEIDERGRFCRKTPEDLVRFKEDTMFNYYRRKQSSGLCYNVLSFNAYNYLSSDNTAHVIIQHQHGDSYLMPAAIFWEEWEGVEDEDLPPEYQDRLGTLITDNEFEIRTDDDGAKCWYLNGQLHRIKYPAMKGADGTNK